MVAPSGVALVKKGWYVRWKEADPVKLPDGSEHLRRFKRKFRILDAANVFAALLEQSGKAVPGSIEVTSRMGKDRVGGNWPKEVPPVL